MIPCHTAGVSPSVRAPERPSRVVVVATGGTIASEGATPTQVVGYAKPALSPDALLAAVPSVASVAEVRAEQLFQVLSGHLTVANWLAMTRRIGELLGRAGASPESDPTLAAAVHPAATAAHDALRRLRSAALGPRDALGPATLAAVAALEGALAALDGPTREALVDLALHDAPLLFQDRDFLPFVDHLGLTPVLPRC